MKAFLLSLLFPILAFGGSSMPTGTTVVVSGIITVGSSALPNGAATEVTLNSILTNSNDIETLLSSTNSLLSTTNTTLSSIFGAVDGIETLIGTGNTNTASIDARLATANTTLTSILGVADQLEGYTDDLETLIGTTNTTLATIDSRVDGLETLVGTTNTTLTTIDGRVDDVETLIGTTNTTLSTIDSRVDGLETLVGTTNSTLTTIDGRVDGLEALSTSIDGKINSVTTAPGVSAPGIVVRQVPYELATFSVVSELTAVGNNKSMIALQNTGTSIVKLREVWIVNDRNTAVTGVAGTFRLLRIASFTGGTPLDVVQMDSTDVLPAGISAATGATVAGESGLLRVGSWSTDDWGPGTLDVEALDHAMQQTEPFWKQVPSGKPITIRPGEGAHIKFSTNSTAGEFNLRFVFTTE